MTDIATRCGYRCDSSAHDVPNAAARPGLPLSTTMSAPAANSMNRSRSACVGGIEYALRLLALFNANGNAGAGHAGQP